MYDILQLNDMLVPELLDIAEQLKIPNAKKMTKQDLVYKILDSQAIAGSKGAISSDGKKKRIIKTNTGITTEEAIVETNGDEPKPQKKSPLPIKKDEKQPVKRGRKKAEEEPVEETTVQPEAEKTGEVRPAQGQIDGNRSQGNRSTAGVQSAEFPEGAPANQGEQGSNEGAGQNKIYPSRREQQCNSEFDGVILSEGVLEMMPDGYGFLRSSAFSDQIIRTKNR